MKDPKLIIKTFCAYAGLAFFVSLIFGALVVAFTYSVATVFSSVITYVVGVFVGFVVLSLIHVCMEEVQGKEDER